MKTIFIAQEVYSNFGGIQKFNSRFIDALNNKNLKETIEEIVVIIKNDNPTKQKNKNLRGKILQFDGNFLKFLLASLHESISSETIIIGHINLLPIGVFAKILNPKIKIVLIIHGIEAWGDRRFRKFTWRDRFMIDYFVSKILSVSNYTAEKILKNTSFSKKNIILFPNVIDAPKKWVEYSQERTGRNLLTVTRLSDSEKQKRVDIIIKALPEIKIKYPDIHLHIVGDGNLKKDLAVLSESLGVHSNITFHGRASNETLNNLYNKSDIFVLPSEKEGFGIVYLEAWKAGLPVVAARATAIPEVVDDGVDGLLIYPVSPSVLAKSLENLLDNAEIRNKMINAGRNKILKKFNGDIFINNLKKILDDIK